MSAIQITVFGRVQGVGFRYTTKRLADDLSIYGSVQNNFDDSVTIKASSSDNTQLEKFIQKVKNSPTPAGKVTDYKETPLTNYMPTAFTVIY
ncbi:acylphosphatase [Dellaglioa sp. P0083]|uniref:acylphosphatase n=1 Tax=Dellaglioa kimchii TaxID=3344667 RepID=UPI0038D51817